MSKSNNAPESLSVSSASCNSITSDLEEIENGVEDGLVISNKSRKPSPSPQPRIHKAKRIRFYHNGNKFFSGVTIPVTTDRYRTFDSLTEELTTSLSKNVTLPSGVRTIFTLDGRKISSIDDLEDGKDYVCSGKGEGFKKLDYSKLEINKIKKVASIKINNRNSILPRVVPPDCIRPRIVTLIRNGIKPRKVYRLLLNKRNASTFDQALSALTETAQLDSGAVRKVFTLSGQPVTLLPQFFGSEDVFFVYGNERFSHEDFELEFEESKAIQLHKKVPGFKNGVGPKPIMPKKELKKSSKSEENLLIQLSRDCNIGLPANIKQKYSVSRVIGDGNFAIVRLCVDKNTNKEHALKIIDKSKCIGKEDMVENEVRILRKLEHPNIMRLVDEQDTKLMLFLVCEYVKGGDLFDAITVAQKFSEDQAALMITHLASGLAYLHNLNIVHRDVKPENLLVEISSEGRIQTLKLGDFGLACEVSRPLLTVCGTPTYVAPEILAETGYGLKIDVWAAGVILYILLCGYPPFVSPDNDQELLFDCILSGRYDFPDEYWHEVSDTAKELIQNMLQLAPELRFSAEDVLDYPWLRIAR